MSEAFFANRSAVLATMHHKETVIEPSLRELGLQVIVPTDFDTDQFGTFSREIKRAGSQLEAARLKAQQAMQLTNLEIGIASEGAFGPHPAMPYLPCNRELVLLIDQRHRLEIVGEAISTETNFSQTQVQSWAEAKRFAEQVGFPQHGLVVIAAAKDDDIEAAQIRKGIVSEDQLKAALEWAWTEAGIARLETDMRAMHNPTRMQVIRRATENLIQKIKQCCPQCNYPGFDAVEQESGLPCQWCGQPTSLLQAVVHCCQNCGFRQKNQFPAGMQTADPAYCNYCNP